MITPETLNEVEALCQPGRDVSRVCEFAYTGGVGDLIKYIRHLEEELVLTESRALDEAERAMLHRAADVERRQRRIERDLRLNLPGQADTTVIADANLATVGRETLAQAYASLKAAVAVLIVERDELIENVKAQRARADHAGRYRDEIVAEAKQARAEAREYQQKLALVQMPGTDVWLWRGDRSELESHGVKLVCPVVAEAETIRELVNAGWKAQQRAESASKIADDYRDEHDVRLEGQGDLCDCDSCKATDVLLLGSTKR